jgi:hypothetical protein
VAVFGQPLPLGLGEGALFAAINVVLEPSAASTSFGEGRPVPYWPWPHLQFAVLGKARLHQIGKGGGSIGLRSCVSAIAPPHSEVVVIPSRG